jgi:nucleotidyltransferase-like protein
VLGGFEALTDNVRSAMTNTSSKGKEIKIPGPDHPITISPAEGKARVTVAGKIVAESQRALRLEEKGYSPVYYLPRCSLRVMNSAGPLEYNGKVVRMALQGLTDPARPLSY